jgi:hypothetical protein
MIALLVATAKRARERSQIDLLAGPQREEGSGMRNRAQLSSRPAFCSRLSILCLALALVSIHSSAQTCSPDAQMFAPSVGYFNKYGSLFWTSDNGTHWTRIILPTPVPEEQVFVGIFS